MEEKEKLSAIDKISNICIQWQVDSPFFAEFLLRFKYKRDDESAQGTIAVGFVDSKLQITYCKEFVENLTQIQLEGILVHEIMHVLNRFRERLGDRDIQTFNIAQDAVINETILDTTIGGRKLELTDLCVRMTLIRSMGYRGEDVTEPVYDFLYEKSDGKAMSKLTTTDCHDLMNKKIKEIDYQQIKEIVENAKVRSWGNVSGNMVSACKELIKTKKISWKSLLRKYLSKYINEPGNIQRNNWSKRNRRNMPLPGIQKISNRIVISVDTSGSIGISDIEKFFSQVECIVKDYSRLLLIEWDTKVQKIYKYKKGDWKRLQIFGRGGTNCQCLYDYFHDNLKGESNIIVNFTDGYFNDNVTHYGINTIWAVVNNDDFKPSFGKVIYIERSQKEKNHGRYSSYK